MVKSRLTLPGSLATLLDQVTLLGIGEVSETTGTENIIKYKIPINLKILIKHVHYNFYRCSQLYDKKW